MQLATLNDNTPDGTLVVVHHPGFGSGLSGPRLLRTGLTLQAALERWTQVQADLQALAQRLAADPHEGEALDVAQLLAPLPRAWQWLDGSAYPTHGELMQIAFNTEPMPPGRPLMYQGMSHRFLSATEDVPLPDEADGIDFEGEFGVITDAVPMGISGAQALSHIKLIVQINDWSLRTIAPIEMKTGFGWIQAKPACSMAPLAVTPEALGPHWREGRVHLTLGVDWNGRRFGRAQGGAMAYGFHELIAHAARTRELCAGTLIGSGTVANADYAMVGSSCISERRAIEMIASGAPQTPFMAFGDTVRMWGESRDGGLPFGVIEQRVVGSKLSSTAG